MSYNRTDLYGDPLRARIRTRFGTVRYRHPRPLRDLAFALDGRMVATATEAGWATLWKAATGKELLRVHAGVELHAVALSARGGALATCGADGVIRVWDTAQGKLFRQLTGHAEEVFALAISPDGRWLASGGGARTGESLDRTVRVWDLETGRVVTELAGSQSAVREVAFARDGAHLAVVGDAAARVYTTDGWSLLHTLGGHGGRVVAARFSSSGLSVVTGCDDGQVRVFRLDTGEVVHTLAAGAPVTCVAISGNTERLAAGTSDGRVLIWQGGAEPAHNFLAHGHPILRMAWSPDDAVLLTAAHGERAVRLWQADTERAILKGEGHESPVTALAVGAGGGTLMSASDDGEVRFWERRTGVPKGRVPWSEAVGGVAVSEEGSLEATAVGDVVVLRDLAFGEERTRLTGLPGRIQALAVSADGRRVAASGGGSTALWRARTGECLWVVEVDCRVLGFDGHTLTGVGAGGRATQWKGEGSRVVVKGGDHPGPVGLSPDCVLTACAGPDGVQVWDTREGVPLKTLKALGSEPTAIAFSHDRGIAAVGTRTGEIWLYAVEGGRSLGTLRGHDGAVCALAFDPEGTDLFSGSEDTTVLQWDLTV